MRCTSSIARLYINIFSGILHQSAIHWFVMTIKPQFLVTNQEKITFVLNILSYIQKLDKIEGIFLKSWVTRYTEQYLPNETGKFFTDDSSFKYESVRDRISSFILFRKSNVQFLYSPSKSWRSSTVGHLTILVVDKSRRCTFRSAHFCLCKS